MTDDASMLALRLARNAEAVCRHYLSAGRREGRYWLVGDVRNSPGRSMFVRLIGPDVGKGAAGKWTDAATGEHGDLLDVIRETCGLSTFNEVVQEARGFLGLPNTGHARLASRPREPNPVRCGGAARRLFAMAIPISGTIAEAYLQNRGIPALPECGGLRFHPHCYYRPDATSPTEIWPAMIAAVTDLNGRITGAHRTWLAPDGAGKAPIDTPRRAMGELLGNAVRFGRSGEVMAAGEGIETVLSIKCAMPTMPMMAALSAAHLAAIRFPKPLRRLYIARDADSAGDVAMAALANRAIDAGIEAITLSPQLEDFNEDARMLGVEALTAALRIQVSPEDVGRFMTLTP